MDTVDPKVALDAAGARPIIQVMVTKPHVFDVNLQKRLLSEHNLKSKIKSQEWSKLTANKKALIAIICWQCDNATLTKLALRVNYVTNHDNENLINFLHRLKVICYESDDGGLSHKPYKIAVAVKLLHNYTNPKPSNPHGFKE